MKPEELDYIQYRLSKSQEAIKDAELLLNNERFPAAVNRLYYACFYAVTALLYSEGLTSLRHNGVISLFGEHWIKTKRLPKEMGGFYRGMYDRRQKGDYADSVSFSREEVEAWLAETKFFAERIQNWLNENVLRQDN